MKDPAVLIPPIATVASQMVFTDGAYFVITLNVTGAQGATSTRLSAPTATETTQSRGP